LTVHSQQGKTIHPEMADSLPLPGAAIPCGPGADPGLATAWWTPALAGPVIAAAVIRLGLLAITLARFGTGSLFLSDTDSYLEPGRNLLLHGRFFADGVPDLVRTPGYPLFLAIASLGGFPVAAAANVILSVFSVILVWKLGRAVFGDRRIALIAAWLFAFEPESIIHAGVLLSDTLFLALFLLVLERLTAFLHRRNLSALAMAGLCLAAATFVRPITYYLPVALAAGLFLALARVPNLRWKAPAVLLLCVLPWLAAWQIRNRMETGYGGFSSAREINLYFQLAAGVASSVEHRPFLEVRKELGYSGFAGNSGQSYLFPAYLAAHPEQAGWNQGQRLAFMRSEAAFIISAHYGIYLRSSLLSLFRSTVIPSERYFDHLLYPGVTEYASSPAYEEQRRSAVLPAWQGARETVERAIFSIVLLGLYGFAVRGIFCRGADKACLWLLLGTSLYLLAVTGAAAEPGGNSRYRLPVMPAVCILAAAGLPRAKTGARRKSAGLKAEAR
jgi:hypothetical protein